MTLTESSPAQEPSPAGSTESSQQADFPATTATPPVPPVPPQPASPSPRRWGRGFAAGLATAALVVSSFALGRAGIDGSQTQTTTPATSTGQSTPPVVAGGTEPVADVAAALTPSMVQIQTDLGLGSGVIYDSSGLILTAAHVVGNQSQVLVQLADGNRIEGRVVGADATSDIAVVKIDRSNLTAARLAIGESLRPGQLAIAIGSPFGLDQTVTSGVISSTSRSIQGNDGVVRELIQTDAPINPGNSGGALADREGRVIGINDQIFSTSGGNEGVGFAIPITYAKEIADKLVAGETIETAVLGVTGTDPQLGTPGALITSVEPGSAAASAGLQSGDLVTAVDGTAIQSFTELAGAIRTHQPGDSVRLTVIRSGQTTELDATLGRR